MRYTRAIVRIPCPELFRGLTSADLGEPDYKTALMQHESYLKALNACGIEVGMLPANNYYPDSCFVEDVALCTPHCAVVTRPGAPSRRGEIEGMEETLSEYFDKIEIIDGPGTLEGGDILKVEDHYYIGLSKRTNLEGAQQLIAILEKYGMTGSVVEMEEGLHLKTGVSYLDRRFLLCTPAFAKEPQFESFRKIVVDPEEAYAANAIWLNGKVLVARGFLGTRNKIEAAGFETKTVSMSEFQKLDGGLSCLSLRF